MGLCVRHGAKRSRYSSNALRPHVVNYTGGIKRIGEDAIESARVDVEPWLEFRSFGFLTTLCACDDVKRGERELFAVKKPKEPVTLQNLPLAMLVLAQK